VEVFADDPVPDLSVTMELFHRALFVVAPHGAGEVNMIFCRPDTVLIEGLCEDNKGKFILCYKRLTRMLGMRYYGLAFEKQCMDITAVDIEKPFISYMKLLGYGPSQDHLAKHQAKHSEISG
jgi:capsular polysaccharide biosynthesis protein